MSDLDLLWSRAPERAPAPDPAPGHSGPIGRVGGNPRRGSLPAARGTAPPEPPVRTTVRGGATATTSVIVYGSSRSLVNLVLFGLAEQVHPAFHWFDVRGPPDADVEFDPADRGWIEPTRLWTVDRFDGLASDNARANAAVTELIRADEPPEVLTRLADLLRLPPAVRRILTEAEEQNEPALLAVANADRIAETFPDSSLPPILDAFEGSRCSLFVGAADPAPLVRRRFDRAIRIDGDSPRRWADAAIELETGPTLAGLPVGRSMAFAEVPFVARVFRRAHASA